MLGFSSLPSGTRWADSELDVVHRLAVGAEEVAFGVDFLGFGIVVLAFKNELSQFIQVVFSGAESVVDVQPKCASKKRQRGDGDYSGNQPELPE